MRHRNIILVDGDNSNANNNNNHHTAPCRNNNSVHRNNPLLLLAIVLSSIIFPVTSSSLVLFPFPFHLATPLPSLSFFSHLSHLTDASHRMTLRKAVRPVPCIAVPVAFARKSFIPAPLLALPLLLLLLVHCSDVIARSNPRVSRLFHHHFVSVSVFPSLFLSHFP